MGLNHLLIILCVFIAECYAHAGPSKLVSRCPHCGFPMVLNSHQARPMHLRPFTRVPENDDSFSPEEAADSVPWDSRLLSLSVTNPSIPSSPTHQEQSQQIYSLDPGSVIYPLRVLAAPPHSTYSRPQPSAAPTLELQSYPVSLHPVPQLHAVYPAAALASRRAQPLFAPGTSTPLFWLRRLAPRRNRPLSSNRQDLPIEKYSPIGMYQPMYSNYPMFRSSVPLFDSPSSTAQLTSPLFGSRPPAAPLVPSLFGSTTPLFGSTAGAPATAFGAPSTGSVPVRVQETIVRGTVQVPVQQRIRKLVPVAAAAPTPRPNSCRPCLRPVCTMMGCIPCC